MYNLRDKNLISCVEKHCTSANPKVSLERMGSFPVVSFGNKMELCLSTALPLLGEEQPHFRMGRVCLRGS